MMDEDAIYNYEDFAKTCYKYPSILNTSKLLNESIIKIQIVMKKMQIITYC